MSDQTRKVHELITDFYSCHTLDDLAVVACDNWNRIVPCNSTVWNVHIDKPIGVWNVHTDKPVINKWITNKGFEETMNTHMEAVDGTMASHPIVEHLQMYPSDARLNDSIQHVKSICSDVNYKDTAIYRNAYRHTETEDQLLLQLYVEGDDSISLTVNTDKRFSEKDVETSEVLQFHLRKAICNLRIKEWLNSLYARRLLFCRKYGVALTERQAEVFDLLVQARSSKEIATELSRDSTAVSYRTVQEHVKAILNKLCFDSSKTLIYEFWGGGNSLG